MIGSEKLNEESSLYMPRFVRDIRRSYSLDYYKNQNEYKEGKFDLKKLYS